MLIQRQLIFNADPLFAYHIPGWHVCATTERCYVLPVARGKTRHIGLSKYMDIVLGIKVAWHDEVPCKAKLTVVYKGCEILQKSNMSSTETIVNVFFPWSTSWSCYYIVIFVVYL